MTIATGRKVATTTADNLRTAERLAEELSDLLDDFGPLGTLQRLALDSARDCAAAEKAALERLRMSLKSGWR